MKVEIEKGKWLLEPTSDGFPMSSRQIEDAHDFTSFKEAVDALSKARKHFPFPDAKIIDGNGAEFKRSVDAHESSLADNTLLEYGNTLDAATLRAAIRVLSDFTGGNENVTSAVELLRDEEAKCFASARAGLIALGGLDPDLEEIPRKKPMSLKDMYKDLTTDENGRVDPKKKADVENVMRQVERKHYGLDENVSAPKLHEEGWLVVDRDNHTAIDFSGVEYCVKFLKPTGKKVSAKQLMDDFPDQKELIALQAVADILSDGEWSPDTPENIAEIVGMAGYVIEDL